MARRPPHYDDYDDDYEDDRPRRRRRRDDDDDDYDDRPRRRSRRDDLDEGELFEPRRKKKGGSGTMAILLLVGGVVLVGGIVAVVFGWFAVSEARDRQRSSNNLKQIGLAMHGRHDATNSLPPQAITDPQGKPLLSWRVAILPYVEQENLYREFHLDEPWDSPHNLALARTTPSVYVLPGADEGADSGNTYYQVLVGNGALFDAPKNSAGFDDVDRPANPFPEPFGGSGFNRAADQRGVRLTEITDGTSNTIMVVEGQTSVPWSKPTDIPYTPGVRPALGFHYRGGCNVLLADGSVRRLPESIPQTDLDAMITRNGGEVVYSDF